MSASTPICYSATDAARALGIGRTRLYELLSSGQLDARKLGKRTLISADSVNRLAKGTPDRRSNGIPVRAACAGSPQGDPRAAECP
jgi:excisionase family DNA binding protein